MKERDRSQGVALTGMAAIGAAFGALAVGALAIGALSVGRMVVRRFLVGDAKFKSEIQDLKITRLHAAEIIVDTPLQLTPAVDQPKTPQP
jgi:hypothetical protein